MPLTVEFFYVFKKVIQEDPSGFMHSWISGTSVSSAKSLGCSRTPTLYFDLLRSLFCLPFALTPPACNTKVKRHSISSEDLHYGFLTLFPSMFWSATELISIANIHPQLEDCPC